MSDWHEDQEWEKEWHGNCVNSLNEELKQLVYAKRMGLKLAGDVKTPYRFDLQGKSILDIGGGAYSLLLKAENYSYAVVADPCEYPKWTYERYLSSNITTVTIEAEALDAVEFGVPFFDEVWMYNVLQHTMNPEKIIKNAKRWGKIVRYFDWIEQGVSKGHPQNLHEKDLNKWFGGIGKVEQLNESGCVGTSYYGIFKGDYYA
jgi:2-polyprenyl-3-methyl-5-hydroxy-6-metoxy-1,4-benzoquinol methylase